MEGQFLPSWNDVFIFINTDWRDAEVINMFTDSSGTLGYGTYFNGAWVHGDWFPHQQLPLQSIQLFVAAACTCGHLRGQRITVHCAIMHAWYNQSAWHQGILHLLRTLFFISAQNIFVVHLVHLPGTLNRRLSRNKLSHLFALAPQANPLIHTGPTSSGRALGDQMIQFLSKALALSTSTTY